METNTFTVSEEISTLRDASYFIDKATRLFIQDNNDTGCYNDEIANRINTGLEFIHELLDDEYIKVQKRLSREVE